MQIFLKKIFIFFILIVLIDISSGYVFRYLREHAKIGDTRKLHYISEECNDDIVILGSSRASRHYAPKIIEDSLGMSCYNCGEPGCGIITATVRYEQIEERHKPKLVIYEVTPAYDYYSTDDYSIYLGKERQNTDKPKVRKIFMELGDNLELLRLYSNMYRNNSFIVQNILDNILDGEDEQGFDPLNDVMQTSAFPGKRTRTEKEYEIDSLKLSYLERLIKNLKGDGIPCCFMVSPVYIDRDIDISQEPDYEPAYILCRKYNIPFINHLYTEEVSSDRRYFVDYSHMNRQGAIAYTKLICSELKLLFNQNRNYD